MADQPHGLLSGVRAAFGSYITAREIDEFQRQLFERSIIDVRDEIIEYRLREVLGLPLRRRPYPRHRSREEAATANVEAQHRWSATRIRLRGRGAVEIHGGNIPTSGYQVSFPVLLHPGDNVLPIDIVDRIARSSARSIPLASIIKSV